MLTKSIRWRLQLWLAFLLISILSGFAVTAYKVYRVNLFKEIDEELGRRLAGLSAEMRPPDGMRGPPPDEMRGPPPFGPHHGRPRFEGDHMAPGDEFMGPHGPPGPPMERREIRLSAKLLSLFDETDTNGFYYVIWSRSGTVLKASTNAPANLSIPTVSQADTTTHTRMPGPTRELFHFTDIGECLLTGRVITAQLEAMDRFAWRLAGAGVAVLALGLGGGWLLVTGAIRPVQEISAAASRISAGNLSERINAAETDSELGRLAIVLNSTFARLEAAFAQQRQFTADASHELRTPLAVIISEAQTTLARERTAAEYRETVEACLGAAQQMRRLTQSLLQLARYDAGQEVMEKSSFDLAEQTRACVELIRPLLAERSLAIDCELNRAETNGDADRIGQVVINLLTNAIAYNKPAGRIRITTQAQNGAAVLTVADTGHGIAPQDLPHIFERFYRADKTRASVDSRNGLGLAICKAIVVAHGGSIEASSEAGVGSTFVVKLPSAAPGANALE